MTGKKTARERVAEWRESTFTQILEDSKKQTQMTTDDEWSAWINTPENGAHPTAQDTNVTY